MSEELQRPGSWFQRILLPGFVFKGVVIGGGYATGRELVEFFFASGPVGALYGILLATLIWSIVCAVSFVFAQAVRGYDYRTFFKALLGPGWVVFELAYIALIILIIAVIAAAAGTTGYRPQRSRAAEARARSRSGSIRVSASRTSVSRRPPRGRSGCRSMAASTPCFSMPRSARPRASIR